MEDGSLKHCHPAANLTQMKTFPLLLQSKYCLRQHSPQSEHLSSLLSCFKGAGFGCSHHTVGTISTVTSDHRHQTSRNGRSLYDHHGSDKHFGNEICYFMMCYPENSYLRLFARHTHKKDRNTHFNMEVGK